MATGARFTHDPPPSPPDPSPSPPTGWLPIIALGIYTITSYGTWAYGFGVLLEPIAESTGWSTSVLGLTYGLSMALSGLLAFVGGRLLDRYGPGVPFLVHGLLASGLMLAAYSADREWWFVVLHGIGGGIAGATGFYAITTVMAARVRPDHPDRAIAVLTMIGAFSSPIYLPATAWLVTRWPWRSVGRALVITGALGAVVAALAVIPAAAATRAAMGSDRFKPSQNPLTAMTRAWGSPTIRRTLLVYSLAGAATSTLWVYQVPIMAATGLALTTAGAIGGMRGFCQLFGRAGLTAAIERFGSGSLLGGAYLLAACGTGLLLGSGLGWFGRSTTALTVAAVGFAIAAGTGLGAASPLQAIHARTLFDPSDLGLLMGMQGAVIGLAGGLGPVLGAAGRDATGSWWFTVTAAIVALALGSALLLTDGRPKGPSTKSLPNRGHLPIE